MSSLRALLCSRSSIIVGAFGALTLVTTIIAQPPARKARPPAQPGLGLDNGGASYVGEAKCLECHATQNKQFVHTVHADAFRKNPKNALQQKTCEACHGPGSKHVADNTGPELIGFTKEWGTPVAIQNASCRQCHAGGGEMHWDGSAHARMQLACSDCHNPMANVSATGLLAKATINDTCYACHKQQRAEFAKRSHMPLPEGKISCTDCHNPHGSTSKALIKNDSVNELCYNCHADKRGPFLWEHAPVRDNCLTCHSPHGSNHDKLLTVARPFECQQCHAQNNNHQGVLYNAGNILGGGAGPNVRMMGRSCQNCHTQIHGSNDPAGARFQR